MRLPLISPALQSYQARHVLGDVIDRGAYGIEILQAHYGYAERKNSSRQPRVYDAYRPRRALRRQVQEYQRKLRIVVQKRWQCNSSCKEAKQR